MTYSHESIIAYSYDAVNLTTKKVNTNRRKGLFMKNCDRCGHIMITGTHFENGQHNRYSECTKCHVRIDGKRTNNNDLSFRDILLMAAK